MSSPDGLDHVVSGASSVPAESNSSNIFECRTPFFHFSKKANPQHLKAHWSLCFSGVILRQEWFVLLPGATVKPSTGGQRAVWVGLRPRTLPVLRVKRQQVERSLQRGSPRPCLPTRLFPEGPSPGKVRVEKHCSGEGSPTSALLTFKCRMFCSILGFYPLGDKCPQALQNCPGLRALLQGNVLEQGWATAKNPN